MHTDKRGPATDPPRQHGQGRHEGSAHDPREFDDLNPARQKGMPQHDDKPVIPGGRKPDTAMCEDKDRPGMIDKDEDC